MNKRRKNLRLRHLRIVLKEQDCLHAGAAAFLRASMHVRAWLSGVRGVAGAPAAPEGQAKKPGPFDSREQFEANLLKQARPPRGHAPSGGASLLSRHIYDVILHITVQSAMSGWLASDDQ